LFQLRRSVTSVSVAAAFAAVLGGCQPSDAAPDAAEEYVAAEEAPSEESSAESYVVEYVARDYAFVGPTEIPSGWVTMRMVNEGQEHHFIFLTLLPEGKTIEDYASDVGTAFGEAWEALRSGAVDKAGAGAMLGGSLPEWYASAASMGGPGLVAPGGVSQATMRLQPGNYVMECYVKTADGEFHSMLGMAIPLTVTAEDSGARPPRADLSITLYNSMIEVEGTPTAGTQTVAVNFDEHPAYGLGNDVHVVRLDEGDDLDEIIEWMDWMNLDGLAAPSPAAFVGGIHEMPSGYTAFFTVDLEPGRYAWIAESGAALGMVGEFTVE
jgi:hypothetical protein